MDVAALPYKIGHLVNGEWKEFKHKDKYLRDSSCGVERVQIGSSQPFDLFCSLVESLVEPFWLMVVLHTNDDEQLIGRYKSNLLSRYQAVEFLNRYRAAFERDMRADLWVGSSGFPGYFVWEKHDHIYAYGQLDEVEQVLKDRGFECGESELPYPHTHHLHQEFDLDFQAMLSEFEWAKTPLEPGDGD